MSKELIYPKEALEKSYDKIIKLGKKVKNIGGYHTIYEESDYGSPTTFSMKYEGRIIETKDKDGIIVAKGETPEKRYSFDIGYGLIFGKIEVGEPHILERNESVKRIANGKTQEQKNNIYDFWNRFQDEKNWKDVKEYHIDYALNNGIAVFCNYRHDRETPIIIRKRAAYMPMMISLLEETDTILPKNLMWDGSSREISATLFNRIYDHEQLFKKHDSIYYKKEAVDYIADMAKQIIY